MVLLALLALAMSGCGLNIQAQRDVPTPTGGVLAPASPPPSAAVPATTVAPPANATPTDTRPAIATAAPIGTRPAVATAATVVADQHFRIDARSTSSRSALERVELVVRSAKLTDERLILRVAFRNTSEARYQIIGTLSGRDAVLVDATGTTYEPIEVSENLRTRIDPRDGFGPGAANVGDIAFPRPSGGEPYELRFPTYAPIVFRLDTPLDTAATATIAPGTYQLDTELRSSEEALRPIALRVRSLQVSNDSLSFEIAFVNVGRQGYTLLGGPSGKDAQLLDAEGSQYKPTAVSTSLATSIAPKSGWLPNAAHTGTITFARPAAAEELRFVFPSYDALTLRVDPGGTLATRVTSPTGGAPQPTPTPTVAEQTFEALEALLANQAQALLAGDTDRYLASFTPGIQPEQQQIIDRIRQMPVVSYTLRLAPDAKLPKQVTSTLDNLPVEVSYTLRGIAPDNRFYHDLRYSFVRTGDTWAVSRVSFDENPPFWLTGDVTQRETAHFLIFARPAATAELPALEQEAETAYAALAARGLPLEPRYVAYFTSTQDDFARLTTRASSRVLGIALSRYDLTGETVTVESRAFYINGEAFTDKSNGQEANDRQTTITHELVHLALAPQTRPFTPPWLAEGAAVYYSEGRDTARRAQLRDSGRLDALSLVDLTRAGSLGEHDFIGEQTSYEYIFSGETFAYLIETFGEQRTLAFYQSYARVPASDVRDRMPRFGSAFVTDAVFADLRLQLTREAVQQFFGITLTQLEADVKAWLRAQ
jgi:hypothetical protein